MGALCLSLLATCMHSFVRSHLEEEELAGFFAIIVLQMYLYCKCPMTLSHNAMGWSTVCDCSVF